MIACQAAYLYICIQTKLKELLALRAQAWHHKCKGVELSEKREGAIIL